MNAGFERERGRLHTRAGGHCEATPCGKAIGVEESYVVTLPGGVRKVFCASCRLRTSGHRVRDSWRGKRRAA